MNQDLIRIGVVGFGYWSPKIINGFNNTHRADVVAICEKNEERWGGIKTALPGVQLYKNYTEMVTSPDVDAVVITTTVSSHYRIALSALKAGKHVLIEKPMAETLPQARNLANLALQSSLTLMVDHTFLFSPTVNVLKDFISRGEAGNIHTVIGARMNLGLFQKDVDVVYDLAPHDFSILQYVFNEKPISVKSWGSSPVGHPLLKKDIMSVAQTRVEYRDRVAYLTYTWLSPVKDRKMMFVGDKGAVVYDMLNKEQQLTFYRGGVNTRDAKNPHDAYFEYITAEPECIPVPHQEGDDLQRVAHHFIDVIFGKHKEPLSNAVFGAEIVSMLAMQEPKFTLPRSLLIKFKNKVKYLLGRI